MNYGATLAVAHGQHPLSPRSDITRVAPISPNDPDDEVRVAMEAQVEQLGMVAESLLTMARRPGIAAAHSRLAHEVMIEGTVDPVFKQLVALAASVPTACTYCQAHTATRSAQLGIEAERIRQVFDFETSELFSDGEKAALRLARDGATVPNAVSDQHFERLREFYAEDEIVELVAVVSFFGWLNRWNDTMATTLEQGPNEFATAELGQCGWAPGIHG